MAILPGIILGIIAMLCWGTADFFVAKAVKKAKVFSVLLWSQLIGIILFFAIFSLFFALPAISLASAAIVMIAGLLGTAGHLAFYKGLQVGKLSIVSPVAACWVVVTVILSMLFLNETLAALQPVGITLAILGTIFSSFRIRDLAGMRIGKLANGIEYAFMALISWGLYFVLIGIMVPQFNWFLPIFFVKGMGVFYLLAYSGAAKQDMSFPKNAALPIFLVGILETAAFLSYGMGISGEYTSIVAPIAAAFPAVTVMLARIILKERLDINQKIGIISVLSGLVLLSL